MPFGYAQKYFESRFQGWLLCGLGWALILHLLVSTIAPSHPAIASMNTYEVAGHAI